MEEAKKARGGQGTGSVCPICGRNYSVPPALSRTDNQTEICPICGMEAALDAAGIKKEAAKELLRSAEEKEIAMGRVEPLQPSLKS